MSVVDVSVHGAAVRLRARLINIRKADRPGMVSVNRNDLYAVLAALNELSDMQMARYLVEITLSELNKLPHHVRG